VIRLKGTYQTFATRTDPAAKTKSMGLADGALFFARHLDCFIMTRQFASIYRDLVPSRQIIVTPNLSSTYRDWQKTRHLDMDANSLNRRAVGGNIEPWTRNQTSIIIIK
jgi:hypothetical protein